MKVLHVSPSFFPARYYGGPIRSGYALCRHLAKIGCEVRVLTTNSDGPTELSTPAGSEVMLDGVRVMYCERRLKPDIAPSLLWRLPEWVRWADVVHITGVFSYSTLPALMATATIGRPAVWTPRGSLQEYGLRNHRIPKALWLAACRLSKPRRLALHVTSEDERRDSERAIPRVPAYLIANGVEIPESVDRTERTENLRLLFLGRLHPVKGVENLITACAMLSNVTLTIAGDGDPEYVRSLRRRVSSTGLDDRIRFAGDVTDEEKQAVFRTSDVLVMPSHSENFGMSVAEALANGLPVIASRATPWRRIEEVGCGLWVENDASSLAFAISRMERMPLEEMGAKGREWILSEFTWRPRALAMAALYQDLIGQGRQIIEEQVADPALRSSQAQSPN